MGRATSGIFAFASFLCFSGRVQAVTYIVKVKSGASHNEGARHLVRSFNAVSFNAELQSGLTGVRWSKPLSSLGFVVVEGEPAQLEPLFRRHALVAYFEKNISFKVADVRGADDADLPSSKALAPWINDLLGLENASVSAEVPYSGAQPVLVGIVDTGLTVSHPYVSAALAAPAENVLTKSDDVSEVGTDHGTHVAGIIKSIRDQAIPQFPEAASVGLVPIRFIGSDDAGSTSDAIAAMDYALARGVKVVNASWGAKGVESFSRALFDTMVELYQNDVFFAVAAGNSDDGSSNNNDEVPYFPSNFNIPGLMSVASVTPFYSAGQGFAGVTFSDFSNYGPTSVDVVAPGDYVDVDGGEGIWSANAAYPSDPNEFIRKMGTSMATPVVAGVAAVVRAINPSLTNYEVKELILSQGTKAESFSMVKSSSLVNAANAFQAARTAVTQGQRPAVPPLPAYYANADQQEQSSDAPVSGCGLIAAAKRGGPGGGNSLGLFAAAYVLIALFRRLSRKSSSDLH